MQNAKKTIKHKGKFLKTPPSRLRNHHVPVNKYRNHAEHLTTMNRFFFKRNGLLSVVTLEF